MAAASTNKTELAEKPPPSPKADFRYPATKMPIPPARQFVAFIKPTAVDRTLGGSRSHKRGFSLADPIARSSPNEKIAAEIIASGGEPEKTSNSGAAAM